MPAGNGHLITPPLEKEGPVTRLVQQPRGLRHANQSKRQVSTPKPLTSTGDRFLKASLGRCCVSSVQLAMAVYKVKVATGDILEAGTSNSISITLVGSRGESRRTTFNYWFQPGTVSVGTGTRVVARSVPGLRGTGFAGEGRKRAGSSPRFGRDGGRGPGGMVGRGLG